MERKTDAQKTILIVEDEKNIVDILRFNLQREGYRTVEAYDGADGLEKARKENPDLILLDVMLPKMIGFDVCRTLREEGNNVPVIILTAREEEADKVSGLEIGADDYITKPFGMMEFVARVKAVLRRSARQNEDKELHYDELYLNVGRHEVRYREEKIDLTRKEFELLQYLLENKGLVMTRNQILCHVWGYDFDGETRTVDVHVRTLRQKLGEAGNLIETVRGVGYRIGA